MKKEIAIGNRKVGPQYPCFTIAEAGVNHNGSLKLAYKLIDVAVEAGADAVKFQSFNISDLILPGVGKAPYQKKTTDIKEDQVKMLEKVQIDESFHESLVNYCEEKKIMFLSTPYDDKSLKLLLRLNVPAIKVASTDANNLLFLEKTAQSGKPVILSTGMSSLAEIELSYNCLKKNGCQELAILKCTANYPTHLDEVNLRAMTTLATIFKDAIIGFSDHTEGVGASPYAVALGAKIIEKHFTLDKTMEGPDHKASLAPDELKKWVKEIRKVEQMLGNQQISPSERETKTKIFLQKCLVSNVEIKKGTIFSRKNVTSKRTGGKGIPASSVYEVLGRKSNYDIGKNKILYWKHLTD